MRVSNGIKAHGFSKTYEFFCAKKNTCREAGVNFHVVLILKIYMFGTYNKNQSNIIRYNYISNFFYGKSMNDTKN